jgi:hypothetical protein
MSTPTTDREDLRSAIVRWATDHGFVTDSSEHVYEDGETEPEIVDDLLTRLLALGFHRSSDVSGAPSDEQIIAEARRRYPHWEWARQEAEYEAFLAGGQFVAGLARPQAAERAQLAMSSRPNDSGTNDVAFGSAGSADAGGEDPAAALKRVRELAERLQGPDTKYITLDVRFAGRVIEEDGRREVAGSADQAPNDSEPPELNPSL